MKKIDECGEVVLAGEKKTLVDESSEANAKMYIKAKDDLKVVHVDHQLMDKEKQIKKCDFMILGINSNTTHLIELKGTNIDAAFEQIAGTIDYFINNDELKDYVVSREVMDAYIVSPKRQKVPNVPSSAERKLVKKLAGGNKHKPKNIFDLLYFVKVVNNQKQAVKNGRQIIISGRAPIELG